MGTLAVNTKVKVNPFLTTDPKNKQGEKGIIIKVDLKEEVYEVQFLDDVIGSYQICNDILEII